MKTSWGGVAGWYDSAVSDKDSYQTKVILPNVLRLLDPKEGKKILDLACGQGYFSHAAAQKGAFVSGVDVAPELIEIARRRASPAEEFYISPAGDLSKFKNGSFDAVLCVLALQNMEKIDDVFWEVYRVLRKGGKFVIVLNHPAFRIAGRSAWQFDENSGVQYRRVDEYMSESKKEIDMSPGQTAKNQNKNPKNVTISFHRPLQVYSKWLFNAGFAVCRIEEWMSHRRSGKGLRRAAEDKARKEIPLFMCLECLKI